MNSRPIRFFASPLLAAGLLAAGAAIARAQDGTVRGVVKDSVGVAVADADVSIVELHQLTRTDARGAFTFTKLPRGEYEVSVRRLGYSPEAIKIVVNDMAYSYTVTMMAQPAVLEAVNVNASELRLRRGLEEFYRRRARGVGGKYFTRQEIAARNARTTSDVLRGTAGVRFVRVPGGNGVRFSSSAGRRGDCMPMIWLDGEHATGMEVDNIPVHDVEAMELYTGPSTTPMQFSENTANRSCGAIVIWTRVPGTP